VPAARRRGHATALLIAAGSWGRERGARWAVLQVALQNDGARALYDRLGYVEHHRYRYLVPPA
jgi:ribosomal protein S18 acetylase RimI-like enzyme